MLTDTQITLRKQAYNYYIPSYSITLLLLLLFHEPFQQHGKARVREPFTKIISRLHEISINVPLFKELIDIPDVLVIHLKDLSMVVISTGRAIKFMNKGALIRNSVERHYAYFKENW